MTDVRVLAENHRNGPFTMTDIDVKVLVGGHCNELFTMTDTKAQVGAIVMNPLP